MLKKFWISTVLGLFIASGCATTRVVRPLEHKQTKVSLDLGGPLVYLFNGVLPLPLSSLSVAYGLEKNVTVFTSGYITDALFGVVHLDAGVTLGLTDPRGWIPGFTFSPSFSWMMDIYQAKGVMYPAFDFNLYWNIAPRNDLVYIGLSNWIETSSVRSHGDTQQNHWIPSLNLGYTFVIENWMLTIEAKYLGFNMNSQYLAVNYLSPGTNGALGAYLSAARLF